MEADDRRDDRILPTTRWLSAVIAPVLLVAFAVLYPWPDQTDRWFAWTIVPTMTPMVLGAAYVGGAYYFTMVLRSTSWSSVRMGFVPVTVFASCLGVATVLHWDRFNHRHVGFWLWALLYFSTPVLVLGAYLRNQRVASEPHPAQLRLSPMARAACAVIGLGAPGLGLFLFLAPTRAINIWPWSLTPLTARVMGAVLMLGVAGLYLALDARWNAARLMLRVAQIMLGLFLVAGVRARDELDGSRPLTWALGVGITVVFAGALALDIRMRRANAR